MGVFPRQSASFRVSRRLFVSLGVFSRLSASFGVFRHLSAAHGAFTRPPRLCAASRGFALPLLEYLSAALGVFARRLGFWLNFLMFCMVLATLLAAFWLTFRLILLSFWFLFRVRGVCCFLLHFHGFAFVLGAFWLHF